VLLAALAIQSGAAAGAGLGGAVAGYAEQQVLRIADAFLVTDRRRQGAARAEDVPAGQRYRLIQQILQNSGLYDAGFWVLSSADPAQGKRRGVSGILYNESCGHISMKWSVSEGCGCTPCLWHTSPEQPLRKGEGGGMMHAEIQGKLALMIDLSALISQRGTKAAFSLTQVVICCHDPTCISTCCAYPSTPPPASYC